MLSLRAVSASLLLCLCCSLTAFAQPMRVDFRQAANNDSPYPSGDVHWVQSILQQNNSTYYEGMSIPQRIMLTNVPVTQGNTHTLTFSHKATKGGRHAFDYLTSYTQARSAANAIVGPTVLQNLNECGESIGPPQSMQQTCNEIRTGPHHLIVPAPDNMGSALARSIASSAASYEARFGNRTIQLHGDMAITNASLVFDGYQNAGQDVEALYTLSWTSASRSVLIEFAAHLAMGSDVSGAGSGIGYGSGNGAGSISGGSYHVRLDRLDGSALGSQDNQIMGAAVLTSIACAISGPDPVCSGSQNLYTFNTSATGLTFSWSLNNNTSGASIVGSSTGQSVTVDAGNGAGEYTVSVIVRDAVQTVICQTPVRVNGFTVTAAALPLLCAGNKTPVTVAASGGVAPYSGVGTFLVHAGTHSFTVTDSRGCSSTATVTITEPPQLNASSSAAQLNCSNGTVPVNVAATGGRPPYNGTGVFHRGAGTHTFTVTDANNCVALTSITINAPSAMTVSANAPAISCFGGTSTVTVTASGGTPPYTGVGTFTRSAGTHTFTVTDANGCSESATVTITQPAAALAASASATPISCFGGNSTVTVSATGGTPPYTGTGSFTRAAGTYTFTVTDANGCTATSAAITITQPASALAVTASATPILCNGGSSTVTVSATGGTPPYTGTGTFSRGAGTYTFSVTDANGCSASSAPVHITQPAAALAVTASATPISCFGGTSTVTVTAIGGTPPYTGTGTFSRTAGTYTFSVTDANGCTAASGQVVITQPSAALAVTVNAPPILCYGGTSNVVVSATGGTPPYTGTGTFAKTAGTYTFTVTDANGCTATSAAITITQPASAMTVTASATPILCSGGNSTVTVSATGGTPPYTGTGTFARTAGTYTFTVTDANGCSASSAPLTITQPPALVVSASATPILCHGGNSTVTVTASGGTAPYTGTGTFTVGAGSYTFTVTDANGCSAMSSVTTIPEPAQLAIHVNAPPILCFGGTSTITVTASGGTAPYTGTGSFTRVVGTYTFTVTDANGCSATSAAITLTQPASAVTVTASATPILCNGGSSTVTVSAAGGTPPYTGTGTFNRGAGTYTFTVTDANGCSANSAPLVITEPPALLVAASATPILCNGGNSTVTVTASGGTPPYTGTGTFVRPAGTYTFTVTDANGCTASSAVTPIPEPALLVVLVNAPPILCHGGSSTVTVSATGGTAPYSGTGNFVLGPGSYTFTVTDANGCSSISAVITLTDPPLLTASTSATPILCYGNSSTVTVTGSGGTPPYFGTGTFYRGPGTWTFNVTDANGCAANTSVTITQPPQLVVTASASPVACGNDSTIVTVSASGGTPPYVGTGTFLRGLGSYTFVVTDANGCRDSAQVAVTGPPPLLASAYATPILCHGGVSTVTVTAWGGTPPYNGTGTFTVGAGTHYFTVTDANSCSDVVIVTITEPPVLVAMIAAPPILCTGGTTVVTVTASGGTPPYNGTGTFTRGAGTYTFVVTDGNGCADSVSITLVDPPPVSAFASATPILCHGELSLVTITASGGTPPYTGTGVFPMGAGTWTFNVADANGCIANTTITITQPPVLNATANTPVVQCGRDSATIIVSAVGGTPPYSGTGSFRRIAGSYTFIVTDANGCKDTVHATVAGPPPLFVTAGSTPILCNGGTSVVTVSAYGGTPPYYGVGSFTVGAGTYTFTVTDANNCSASITITVTEPPPLVVVCSITDCENGVRRLSATVTGGTPPYSYYWMPFGVSAPTVDIPCSFYGLVTLRVRDANWTSSGLGSSSCEATCSIQVFAKSAPGESDVTAQSANDYMLYENYPNPFNPSTTIRYFLPEASQVRLSVVNTLGSTITTLVDTEVPAGVHSATWNAVTDDGGQVPSGSYIYRIQATSKTSGKEFMKERIMLLLR